MSVIYQLSMSTGLLNTFTLKYFRRQLARGLSRTFSFSPPIASPPLPLRLRLRLHRISRSSPIPSSMRALLTALPCLRPRPRLRLRLRLPLRPNPPVVPAFLRFQTTSPSSAAPRSPAKDKDTQPQLQLTFTCTANNCGHRSTHTFAKRSYQSGIVLLQCPACKNRCVSFLSSLFMLCIPRPSHRHLIADHLGWFNESTENGMFKTVESLLRAKGEHVQRGSVYDDGTIEILPEKEEESTEAKEAQEEGKP